MTSKYFNEPISILSPNESLCPEITMCADICSSVHRSPFSGKLKAVLWFLAVTIVLFLFIYLIKPLVFQKKDERNVPTGVIDPIKTLIFALIIGLIVGIIFCFV